MNRDKEKDLHYDYIRYEDSNGNKIPKSKIGQYKGGIFKCWVVGKTRVQIKRIK